MSPTRPSLALVALASAALAVAAAYEGPRTFQASEVLKPPQVKGPHFQVAAAVPTEGYFHVFSITTDYGPLEAEGSQKSAEQKAAAAAGGVAAKGVVPIPMVVSSTATVGNLVWGKDPEELLKYNEQRLKELGATRLELQLAGTATPPAKKELAARGWTVVENVPLSMEVAQAAAPAAR
jgi:hypothetical protein